MSKQFLLLILIVFGIQVTGFSQIDSTYQDFEEILITSEREKKIVFEDSKFYIVDFTVSETRILLLMRKFRNYYIYELDEEMQLRHRLQLNIKASSFFDDCFGNTHLLTKDSVYFVMNDSMGVFLADTHPRDQFMDVMTNCTGSTSEKIIFKKLADYNQNQKFYTVDIDSGDKKVIYQINDSTVTRSLTDAEVLIQTDDYYSNHQRMGDIDANKEMSFLIFIK